MIKIEKLHRGFIILEPGMKRAVNMDTGKVEVNKETIERAISTIPELRRAIGGWACSKINKGRYAKYIVEIKGVK